MLENPYSPIKKRPGKSGWRTKILVGIIILIFGTLIFAGITLKNNKAYYAETNITSDELFQDMHDGASETVYFYNELCPKCVKINGDLKRSAEAHKANLKTMDTGVEPYWNFDVEHVPTVIYYKDGDEVDRIEGIHSRSEFDEFFKKNVVIEKEIVDEPEVTPVPETITTPIVETPKTTEETQNE